MKNNRFKQCRLAGNIRHSKVLLAFTVIMTTLVRCSMGTGDFAATNSDAPIFPEYYGLTLPPNIAPLNFIIKGAGCRYRIEISSEKGKAIVINQKSPHVEIPVREWHRLLGSNAGKDLRVDIREYADKQWKRYNVITHHISADSIDAFLVYRLVHAVYLLWRDMGIYQRNLTNFDEIPVIENSSTDYGCINCHAFAGRDPSRMMIHFRLQHDGTLVWNSDSLSVINTKDPSTLSGGVYPSWHPGGKHIAFSVGKLNPHLTTRSGKTVDVSDKVSDLMIYDLENRRVITSPRVSTSRRENLPVWSPDGKYIYFTSAPEAITGDKESRLHAKYDLMRIAFDTQSNEWGEPEMVLSSGVTGKSISMPSISPDGKMMVCAMTDYGYFTIFHKESDLYLVNPATGEYREMEINSGSAESYSSWSSNGRWLVFSSKRLDEVFTVPHIAYIDSSGNTGRPFALPQKDPGIYLRTLANFNRPELITGKIELTPRQIRDAVVR
ncbi:MAG TPA: hypothetical protein PK582_01275 [Prolixibacteraceae bacterium]|jgi:hypothetical protein|nr:hypothetical protein [Prolixibacteraceae bacterium]